MVGVAPEVVGAVDIVSRDEGGVAAAVVQSAGVGAEVQINALSTIGDGGQDGGVYLGETVDNSVRIGGGCEGGGVERVGVGPDGVVAGAVGVMIEEDDRSGAVGVDVGGAVRENGFDGSAANVCDEGCGRGMDIHQAGHGCAVVGGHVGDDIGHHDMESEGPRMSVARAIRVGIAIDDVALASVEVGTVDGDVARCEGVAAGVGDGRQGDAVGGDVGQAVDGGLAGSSSDSEVFRNDMVSVGPCADGVVDRVGEGIDRVAASIVADKGRAGERERDHAVADRHGRGDGHEDIAGAMDGGAGVSHGGERHRRDGIDELPWIVVAGAVGVGVLVGDGAMAVCSDVQGRVGGACRGDNLAPAGIGERVGSGFDGIAGAGHGGGTVSGDGQGGKFDVEGEGPAMGMAGAVCVGICEDNVALASVEGGAVDDGGARCERVAAGTDDCGQGDAVCGDLRETTNSGGAILGVDAEV